MERHIIEKLLVEKIDNNIFNELASTKYDFIVMTTEYFVDISEVRYRSNVRMGIEIQGFKQVLETAKKFNELNIVMNCFTSEKIDLGVYTNENGTILLGIIDFNIVTKQIQE